MAFHLTPAPAANDTPSFDHDSPTPRPSVAGQRGQPGQTRLGTRRSRPGTRRAVRTQVTLTVSADLTALLAATVVGLLALAAVTDTEANSLSHLGRNLELALPFPLVTEIMFFAYGLYRQRRRRFRPRGFHDAGLFFHAVAAGTLATLGVSVLIHRVWGDSELTSGQLAALALSTLLLVPFIRAAYQLALQRYRKVRTRVLIVGSGVVAEQVRQRCMEDPGIEVAGMVDDDPAPGTEVVGRVSDIGRICHELEVDRLVVTFSRSHPSSTVDTLRNLHGAIPISLVPRYFELMTYRSQMDEIDGLPMVDVAPSFLGPGAIFTKRALDIVGSVVGLVMAMPVLAGACLAIKCSSRGPVLFSQIRTGRDGLPFRIWKLRTMQVDTEHERELLVAQQSGTGPSVVAGVVKVRKDPRVFPAGRLLRRLSIDEIPQLFNVLRGEMSLVGPRPFIPEDSQSFADWASRRFKMRPGVTGLWQVSGRSDLSHDDLQRLDYLYVASWSIFWDLRILWKTPTVVVRGRGAY